MKSDVWILFDKGKTGTLMQCRGIADLFKITPKEHALKPSFFKHIPSVLWGSRLEKMFPQLDGQAPKIIIGSGKLAAKIMCCMKKRLGDEIFNIYIMDPRTDSAKFDVVIAPSHDKVAGDNVIATLGTMHTVNALSLQQAKDEFSTTISSLPAPYTAIVLGGNSNKFTFRTQDLRKLLQETKVFYKQKSGSILVTTSRRTDQRLLDLLPTLLQELSIPYCLTDSYQGVLASCDDIIVTCDSVSMISEACITGARVYVYPIPGKAGKFESFYSTLYCKGHARPFVQKFTRWAASPMGEQSTVKNLLLKNPQFTKIVNSLMVDKV